MNLASSLTLVLLLQVAPAGATGPATAVPPAASPAPVSAAPVPAALPASVPGPVEPVTAVVAAARAGGASSPTALRRISVPSRTAYDQVRKVMLVRVPDEVLREVEVVPDPGAAAGTPARRRVRSYRLAPTQPGMLAALEFACAPKDAGPVQDDLVTVVELRLPAGPSAVTARTADHAATKAEPWPGTVETVTLAADVASVTVGRRSTGAVLAHRAEGQAAAAPAAPPASQGPRTSRTRGDPRDAYGRTGSQWTMKDMDVHKEACVASTQGQGDALAVARICRCMLEALQVRYPVNPPAQFDAETFADVRSRCAPRNDAPPR